MADLGYTTEEKIEKFLNVTIATGDANNFILASQEAIENYTNRVFKADSVASARYYDGNDRVALVIDENVDVSGVAISSDGWGDSFEEVSATGTDRYYVVEPRNFIDGKYPIWKIGLRSQYFLSGFKNIKVTAKWGYSTEVPDDISFVATVLAGGMYNASRTAKSGAVSREKLFNYEVNYADEKGFHAYNKAIEILDNYILREL